MDFSAFIRRYALRTVAHGRDKSRHYRRLVLDYPLLIDITTPIRQAVPALPDEPCGLLIEQTEVVATAKSPSRTRNEC